MPFNLDHAPVALPVAASPTRTSASRGGTTTLPVSCFAADTQHGIAPSPTQGSVTSLPPARATTAAEATALQVLRDVEPDKRMALAGRRVAGYSGHVPQYHSMRRRASLIANPPPALPPVSEAPAPPDAPRPWPVRTATAQPKPRHTSGYGGHRQGALFTAGESAGGGMLRAKGEELAAGTIHGERTAVSMKGEPVLPRYPVLRGPWRRTAFGHECFLTN